MFVQNDGTNIQADRQTDRHLLLYIYIGDGALVIKWICTNACIILMYVRTRKRCGQDRSNNSVFIMYWKRESRRGKVGEGK